MEKKRIIKVKGEKLARRIDFPVDFNSLIQKIQEFMPLNDPNKRYQLIEEKANREITSEEDFQIMSKEFINENVIKITIKIVDKNTKFIIPDFNKKLNICENKVSNEASINLVGKKKEEEIENPINSILKEKMKELEDKLVEELYNNLKNEISKSKIENNEQINIEVEENNIIKMVHTGIVCNKCGKKDIEGKRYKCAQCANFNLCENCEKNYIHDMKHIMISILYPLKNDNEINSKINKNICYKNQDMNYNIEPKIFNLDKIEDNEIQQIKIKNTGSAPWRGVYLKFVDKSEIFGENCEINYNVNSGSSINDQIIFANLKNQIKPNKKVYYCFLQMFNQSDESFGNITKIKVYINN